MQYNTCNYLNDNFGNRTKRHQPHPLFRRYCLSHYILYHAFQIQSAIFAIRKWFFWAFGLVGASSLMIRDFLRFEKTLSADSSVSIDWPTFCTWFRGAGRRPFCRFFRLKSEKILLAKMGQAGKNFRGSKIFDGWILVKTKRGLRPGAPCNGLFDVLYDAKRCQNS